MNFIIEEEKVHNFIKNYFIQLWSKRSLILDIVWILYFYITDYKISIVTLIAGLFVSILVVIRMSNLSYRDNIKYVKQFYSDDNYDDSMKIVCNLRKYDGPTFGVLYIFSEKIMFIPFKENLKYESTIINFSEIKNIYIKKPSKDIKFLCDSREILFSLPEGEYSIKKIKQKMGGDFFDSKIE
ncbi:hypothetical protein [Clostridium lundense]|uniref:hypothetical protein n=1 Tax=Clostridium lundense TaxID=319475 RepID=UPI000482276C|nr:hypothetical protein [Clostridium lundense]